MQGIWKRSCRLALMPWLMLWLLLIALSMPAYSASKNLLVLGDSLSAEYGLPRGSGWVNLLQQKLVTADSGMAVVNASISGETTAGGKVRLPALLKQHRPAVLILELGGNDGLRGLSLTATRINLGDMVRTATAAGARVLVLGMQMPPNYGPDYSRRFAAMYQDLGRERGVSVVPFFLVGLEDTDRFFQPDRIHPNQQAQALMLENVWSALKPMLKPLLK